MLLVDTGQGLCKVLSSGVNNNNKKIVFQNVDLLYLRVLPMFQKNNVSQEK